MLRVNAGHVHAVRNNVVVKKIQSSISGLEILETIPTLKNSKQRGKENLYLLPH